MLGELSENLKEKTHPAESVLTEKLKHQEKAQKKFYE
jgi:hypothetical protein